MTKTSLIRVLALTLLSGPMLAGCYVVDTAPPAYYRYGYVERPPVRHYYTAPYGYYRYDRPHYRSYDRW